MCYSFTLGIEGFLNFFRFNFFFFGFVLFFLLQVASFVDKPNYDSTEQNQRGELGLDREAGESGCGVGNRDGENRVHAQFLGGDHVHIGLALQLSLLSQLLLALLALFEGEHAVHLAEEQHLVGSGAGELVGRGPAHGVATVVVGDREGGEDGLLVAVEVDNVGAELCVLVGRKIGINK